MLTHPAAQRIEQWPIDRLVPFAQNPRTHSDEQVAQIAASIREFGFNNPILVDSDAGIIAGHGRLLASQQLELAEVPVIVLGHLTDKQKRAYVIADNQLALGASWDERLLREQLAALQAEDLDLDILGFGADELARLLAAEDTAEGLTDEDAAPDPPAQPTSALGDVWLLGRHRLIVGDATNATDVDRLMAGEAADLVVTDSPYNVNYEGYTEDRLKIQSDNMSADAFANFLGATFRSYRALVKPTASLYVFHGSSWQREFQNAMEAAGFTIRCQIIWAKNTFAWGFGRYKHQHEPIFAAYVTGQKDAWYGNKSQSTLWEVNKPAANRLHPTMKPIALIERALINSSKAGDLVVDLFGGSGSTLIACERKKRRAGLMELDPCYADVIVRRFEEYTGQEGTLDGDGRTFTEVQQMRRLAAA